MDNNMEDMKEKEEKEEEEAFTGPRSRIHVGLKEEKRGLKEETKVWKQQLLNKWMAPEKDNKLEKRKSMIQKDLSGDTNQSKRRARKN